MRLHSQILLLQLEEVKIFLIFPESCRSLVRGDFVVYRFNPVHVWYLIASNKRKSATEDDRAEAMADVLFLQETNVGSLGL